MELDEICIMYFRMKNESQFELTHSYAREVINVVEFIFVDKSEIPGNEAIWT